jgi:hypothetical protein
MKRASTSVVGRTVVASPAAGALAIGGRTHDGQRDSGVSDNDNDDDDCQLLRRSLRIAASPATAFNVRRTRGSRYSERSVDADEQSPHPVGPSSRAARRRPLRTAPRAAAAAAAADSTVVAARCRRRRRCCCCQTDAAAWSGIN